MDRTGSRLARGCAAAGILAGMGCMPGSQAWAQDYAVRPLRLVTMFAPGASADQHGRHIAARLTEQLGQQVIVESKGGAGGLLAVRDVIRTQPLGYSMLLANPSMVGNSIAYRDPGYKPEDLAPIGVMGQTYYGMMIHVSVPAKTVAEFIAHAKAHPGKLNYGGLGAAAGSTLSAERFKQAAGVDMVGIPFKGGDPTAAALLAGEIQVYFATLSTVKVRMKSPQIRVLAITSQQRSTALPELPTFRELGLPAVQAANWNAVFVPTPTPAPMQRRLREAYAKAAASEEMKTMVESQGYEPWTGTLEQFSTSLRSEAAQLVEDYRRLKIQLLD